MTQKRNFGFIIGGVIKEIIILFKFSCIIPACFFFLLNFYFWSRKGYSTILYVTLSFVLPRLFSSLVNISGKFRQTMINLKVSEKDLGTLIHFPWFQIWILVPIPRLNLVETKLYIHKINVKAFPHTIFFSKKTTLAKIKLIIDKMCSPTNFFFQTWCLWWKHRSQSH